MTTDKIISIELVRAQKYTQKHTHTYTFTVHVPSHVELSPANFAPTSATSSLQLLGLIIITSMAGLLTGPASTSSRLSKLFVPGVCLLVVFLGYTSQLLLNTAEYLEPGPLTERETTIFNILLVCLWSTYYKACTVPPGRYNFPSPTDSNNDGPDGCQRSEKPSAAASAARPNERLPQARWCKKCAAPKPLRAHHCKHCGTCIPKMDHHCPWTANCVSLQTFPYFLRFLVYTNLALSYLHLQLLYPRFRCLFWDNSKLPAYLGPSVPVMVHLTLLGIVGGLTSIALLVLLVTTVRSWVLNQTMIEGWEQERHEAVLLRHQRGGWWTTGAERAGAGGRINRVEFPYDVGFFANMAQAMGTRNILAWLDPFVGSGPKVAEGVGKGTGWEWEENGFNDREGMWPPPDPDRMRRGVTARKWPAQPGDVQREELASMDDKWRNPQDEVAAFRARQEMDLRRRTGTSGVIGELEADEDLEDLYYSYVDGASDSGSGPGYDDDDENDDESDDDDDDEENNTAKPAPGRPWYEQGVDGEPGWTNSEGDRLRDYGVDEDAEDDDEDVPLGELLRRRRAYGSGKG